jgi:DNA-3-methyladenine glycosylase
MMKINSVLSYEMIVAVRSIMDCRVKPGNDGVERPTCPQARTCRRSCTAAFKGRRQVTVSPPSLPGLTSGPLRRLWSKMPPRLRRSFFDRSVHEVAPELIGATLLVDGAGGVIVEVEAYHHTDPAAHSYNGRTERNAVMFGPAGYAYVYRSYGIHWCLNFVCEEEGSASAVLIRAIAPAQGIASMRRRRGLLEERALCSGPGKLCEALGVTQKHNGLPLDRAPFELRARKEIPKIASGVRIGITKAAEKPWRYGLLGSKFLSKPFR